jgi:Arabinose efflux permease
MLMRRPTATKPHERGASAATPSARGALIWLAVLAGGIVMGMALGVRHVQGLFLLPVTLDRGWSRELFGMAMAVQNLTWGLAQPFTGMVADRWGSARVIVAGMACYALGLVLMAHADTPAAFVLSAGVCIGVALSGTAFAVIYGALSRLVPAERRSWALGMAGAAGGLGQFLLVPVAQVLIDAWGWVAALLAFAAVMAMMLPLALPMRDRPAALAEDVVDMPIGQAVREAFGHKGFWMLNAGFLACGFQLAFIATHLPAYLADRGLDASHAVVALAIIALANVAGTYYCGLLGGMFRRKYLLSGVYLVRAAAMALFVWLPPSPWTLYAFACIMGMVWLGTVPLTSGLLSQVFGVRYITTLFGFVFFGHQVGSFLGVWLGGLVFEVTGSYAWIWAGAIALGVLAAALHWPIDDREITRPAAVAA